LQTKLPGPRNSRQPPAPAWVPGQTLFAPPGSTPPAQVALLPPIWPKFASSQSCIYMPDGEDLKVTKVIPGQGRFAWPRRYQQRVLRFYMLPVLIADKFGVRFYWANATIKCELKVGAPGETRTPDLLVRSQPLYPTELRARTVLM